MMNMAKFTQSEIKLNPKADPHSIIVHVFDAYLRAGERFKKSVERVTEPVFLASAAAVPFTLGTPVGTAAVSGAIGAHLAQRGAEWAVRIDRKNQIPPRRQIFRENAPPSFLTGATHRILRRDYHLN